MNPRLRIVGVSDVSIGLGSTIIVAFMNSVVSHYGADAILIEPDQPEVPPTRSRSFGFALKRISTLFHPHNHRAGHIEYINRAAEEVENLQPDILVIFCSYAIPVAFKVHRRPPMVIYYAIELTSSYGKLHVEMGQYLNSVVDLIIYPEENRAILEDTINGSHVPSVVLYNCANKKESISSILPIEDRNGRILYSGTLDLRQTCFDYFLDKKMRPIPVDLFGRPSGIEKTATEKSLNDLRGEVRYMGYVENTVLEELRNRYCYSIVIWRPLDDNHFYAAPNKFFEAISSGVPPITAPHPQCKMLVERYRCGIIMRDWTFEAFYESIQRALSIYHSSRYSEMVDNCRKAIIEELNWETQFDKVKPYLPERS